MINRIVDAALGNRMLVLMLIAALVAAGLLSMQRLPFDADPDISPLQVLVTTPAPGLAPMDVERSITTPIELALQGLPGMTSYRSISRYGLSVIYVKFADGGDILTDRTLVAQRLNQASLPAEAGTPRLGPLSDGLSEIYQFRFDPGLAGRAAAQAGPGHHRGQRQRRRTQDLRGPGFRERVNAFWSVDRGHLQRGCAEQSCDWRRDARPQR
jgi:Cu/Ag efflux pump CusA